MASKKAITITLRSSSRFPAIRKARETKIGVLIDDHGNVDIIGNSKGLLYLARHIAIMGLMNRDDGFHIHLTVGEGQLDRINDSGMVWELTIGNSEFLEDSSGIWSRRAGKRNK